jgi:cyanophycinase-like exopeptidase
LAVHGGGSSSASNNEILVDASAGPSQAERHEATIASSAKFLTVGPRRNDLRQSVAAEDVHALVQRVVAGAQDSQLLAHAGNVMPIAVFQLGFQAI